MRLKIAVLAGDGIGPEVTNEAVSILKAVAELGGHDFTFTPALLGGVAITAHDAPFPTVTRDIALNSDAVLLGAVGDNKFNSLPPEKRPEGGILQLRQALGGFANLRPSLAFKALTASSPLRPEITENVDILFVRELLGGLYFGQPRWWNKETNEAINTMRYTRSEIVRVARVAFELAAKRRFKVTSVDKANVLEVSQLWRATVTEVAKDYPDIEVKHIIVDAAATALCLNPRQFDVMVMENMFGDILSDLGGGLLGSLGLMPSACIGAEKSYYEPSHGSAPDIAGKGVANPYSMIGSVAMMLEMSFGLEAEARAVWDAMRNVFGQGFTTSDLRTTGDKQTVISTSEFGDKVVKALLA